MKRSDITDDAVVDACARAHAEDARSLDVLMASTRAPRKVALAAMYRACGNGRIDWGVTIELAWPCTTRAT
ncbi:hypothetical protein [Amycolatopsis dendrobii]|uniref:Uncharacterized protein n=1 Tax=Amycolatopsis dendrobii TaxID=2760662 RepID=A0A7W3VVN2_9PSEU|nr:hypothetical protein [Amycolatopsis dendrobii]MBB1153985.1 hypothetical protein [Amycolatopsis dendrobii]